VDAEEVEASPVRALRGRQCATKARRRIDAKALITLT
jgi:hypothetical protein